MKKILLSAFAAAAMLTTQAQFGTAPDFTVTDMDGNSHTLSTYLNAGYVVVLDVSATWCGPCWTLHEAHHLENIHQQYGPNGTNQVRVLFYEGDPDTDDAAMQGSGNTLGDWTTGVTYPLINEAPVTLDLNVYAPAGYPTVSVIRPSDAEITTDMWNFTLAQMQSTIEGLVGGATGVEEKEENVEFSVFPNPGNGTELTINLGENVSNTQITITDLIGKVVYNESLSGRNNVINFENRLSAGTYIVSATANNVTSTQKLVVK